MELQFFGWLVGGNFGVYGHREHPRDALEPLQAARESTVRHLDFGGLFCRRNQP